MHYGESNFKKNEICHNDQTFPTVEAFDAYLESCAEEITSSVVCDAVRQIFAIDIDLALVLHPRYDHLKFPRAAIHSYLKQIGTEANGASIRSMIKALFGINLAGIAELYNDRIALYSKGQWIVKNDQALFLVHTSYKDADVKILSTPYFKNQTKMAEMPSSLQQALAPLGYSYNEKEQALFYSDPTGQPVSGQFKVQTMKTIARIVHTDFAGL
ncbi:hypothetical protein [Planomicrobium sp. CPCC 101079]|uniref:hypothetical protein n=1 Tax=Planomicrobium sp. CPCC 101079 TaxID=2599618 RepID=UPI0011B5DAA6|nr:hypothetical protein [Planomicrobium sp. CPCC 101079]TWT09363.1 hypothetical protein FQV28_06945 [Planomicrobium sp. CPCC 101079]